MPTNKTDLPLVFNADENYTSPERRLMLATVLIAVTDALGEGAANRSSERDQARREALAWFRAGGTDFDAVCCMAGLDPAATRRAVLSCVASGAPISMKRRVNREPKLPARLAA